MAVELADALDRVREASLADATLVRTVGAGKRPGTSPRWRRVELRWVDVKAGRRLQVTSYDQRRAHTVNHPPGAAAEAAVDEALAEPFANWHVDTIADTMQVRVTAKGDAMIHVRRRTEAVAPDHGHDRVKRRLLDPAEPWLHAVGISDHEGRVKPSRQGKYRQVEEFLRALDAAVDAGSAAGALPADEHGPAEIAPSASSISAAATPT